jgi:beta-galactosidase
VAADRTPHPVAVELAKVVQPVQVAALDAARGVLQVTNELDFLDLSWLRPAGRSRSTGSRWRLVSWHRSTSRPGRQSWSRCPPLSVLTSGQAAHLTLSFLTLADLPWAPAGHVVAWEQVELARSAGASEAPPTTSPPTSLLDRLEPTIALWRAPIDNETFTTHHAQALAELGLRDGAASPTWHRGRADPVGGTARDPHRGGAGRPGRHPAVGVRLHVGPGVHAVAWLGEGPARVLLGPPGGRRGSGRWSPPVADWSVPYVHPQANGNRCGVRWLRLLDADGEPLLTIDTLDGLDVTVARVTDDELADGPPTSRTCPTRDDCFVWIDARHRGVGSGAVGPDTAPEHRVGPGTYHWSYRLS